MASQLGSPFKIRFSGAAAAHPGAAARSFRAHAASWAATSRRPFSTRCRTRWQPGSTLSSSRNSYRRRPHLPPRTSTPLRQTPEPTMHTPCIRLVGAGGGWPPHAAWVSIRGPGPLSLLRLSRERERYLLDVLFPRPGRKKLRAWSVLLSLARTSSSS